MKNFTSIFSKIKINRGGHFLGFGMNPETDWKLMLITSFLILIITLTACVYYFLKVNNGDFLIVGEEDNAPSSSFNINRVRQTINYYENKSKELEKIKTSTEIILDPSL